MHGDCCILTYMISAIFQTTGIDFFPSLTKRLLGTKQLKKYLETNVPFLAPVCTSLISLRLEALCDDVCSKSSQM